LPQNSATAMAQAADDYFWVGPFNGLVRFDGSQFILFDCDKEPGLEDPRIIDLRADPQGRLWFVRQSWG